MTNNNLINNRYELIRPLGQGGQGDVFLCYDHRLERQCACKRVDCRGYDEINALKAINSPLLPRIIDVYEIKPATYIFMDYCDGIPIKDVLKRRTLSEKEIIAYGLAICECILQLHNSTPPMLYLDCKPGNIMLTNTGEIRLVDLGSALTIDRINEYSISGTPWYSSPEQQAGRAIDVRADIYSLGKTLYYMACGSKVEYRNEKGYLDVRGGNPAISARLSRVIGRCCTNSPSGRYQSINELKKALENCQKVKFELNISCVFKKLFSFLSKVYLGLFSVLSAQSYSNTKSFDYLLLCFTLLALLIHLCRESKICVITPIENIYMGVGKRILPIILLLCGGILCSEIALKQIKNGNPQVTIVDSCGYYCLYKDQSIQTKGDDIVLRIPVSSLEYGTLPSKIIVR